MIIDYDHNPNLTEDQKLDSLKESVQMALNEEHLTILKLIEDAIASKLLKRETLTYTSEYVAGSITVERVGKVASITLMNMSNVPNGTLITLFTLPEDWRPEHTCLTLLRSPSDASNTLMRMQVRASGQVEVYLYGSATSTASTNASATLTYIIK